MQMFPHSPESQKVEKNLWTTHAPGSSELGLSGPVRITEKSDPHEIKPTQTLEEVVRGCR